MKKLIFFLIISVTCVLIIVPVLSFAGKDEPADKPTRIILLIGDGMGSSQIYAALTRNGGRLNLERCTHSGFSKTYSANSYITDSGAGATALATGKKTYNGAIGVDKDTVPVKTILEYAESAGLTTALISTSAITHATPASFIAHEASRSSYENIAVDFLDEEIEVVIGGGLDHFSQRTDNRNLVAELRDKGYRVYTDIDSVRYPYPDKLYALTAPLHNIKMSEGRGNFLAKSVRLALNVLTKNNTGFFMMVEGSQIDWGGHANNQEYVISEMLDFDKAINEALNFAERDGNTLVIVTADHETGGMTVLNGNFEAGTVNIAFSTTGHTAVMVPVFAFGPGAEEFTGIMENTDIFYKMMKLLQLKLPYETLTEKE